MSRSPDALVTAVFRARNRFDALRLYLKCDVLRSEVSPELKYWVGIEGLFSRFFGWLGRLHAQRAAAAAGDHDRGRRIVRAGGGGISRHLLSVCTALLINRATGAPGHSWIWWTILTPALGGLIAGLGLTYWVPAAAGSGIPQVKTAYTFRFGAISLKETLGKFVLCTLQLGSGASLGVEGPTVQICAGVSSFLARMARLSPVNTPAHGVGGHGGGHCRGLQRADCGGDVHAGGADREPGPDDACGRDCGRGAGGRGGARRSGIESDFSGAAAADVHAGQGLVAGVVCAAGTAGGDRVGGVYRFAAVAARRGSEGSSGFPSGFSRPSARRPRAPWPWWRSCSFT